MTWQDNLATIIGADSSDHIFSVAAPFHSSETIEMTPDEDTLGDQVKALLIGSAEMLWELGKGCRDILEQSFKGFEETSSGKEAKRHWEFVSRKLGFLNEYLSEDQDLSVAWPIVIAVFLAAFIVDYWHISSW